jgi:hypothetical protein
MRRGPIGKANTNKDYCQFDKLPNYQMAISFSHLSLENAVRFSSAPAHLHNHKDNACIHFHSNDPFGDEIAQ